MARSAEGLTNVDSIEHIRASKPSGLPSVATIVRSSSHGGDQSSGSGWREIDLVHAGHHELIVDLLDGPVRDVVAERIDVLVGMIGFGSAS